MNAEPGRPAPQDPPPPPSQPQRLFLFEPGWGVGLKVGNARAFCYMMAPGQDYYHRLLDGEIYLFRGDERLCLACAERRGLLSFEPRGLREPMLPIDLLDEFDLNPDDAGTVFRVEPAPGDEGEYE
jgi:hypothetical protein